MGRRTWWICGALVAVGAAVRLGAVFNDLWLDEIWSWNFARHLGSPLSMFQAGTTDNNHPLNTLYLWLLGDQARWFHARWASYAAAVAALAIVPLLGRRWGGAAALITTGLCAGSFLLVVSTTEARGYAAAVLFAEICFLLCFASGDALGRWKAPLFWLAVLAGLLAHPSFIFVYAGCLAAAAASTLTAGGDRRSPRPVLLLHGPPVALVGLFLVWYRQVIILGGHARSPRDLTSDLGSFAFGLPGNPALAAGGAFLLLVVGLREIWLLRQERAAEWPFFLVAIYLAPPAALLLSQEKMWYPRYVLVSLPFLYLLLARSSQRIWLGGSWGRVLLALLAAAFLVGNAGRFAHFLRDGRGRYAEAVGLMANGTAGPVVSVGGDQDNRIEPVVRFYWQRLSGGKNLQYLREALMRSRVDPEWFIDHSVETTGKPSRGIVLPNGRRYLLVATFPSTGLSGHTWNLYRRN